MIDLSVFVRIMKMGFRTRMQHLLVCFLLDYLIKLNPPSNLKIVQGSNVHFLTWHPPSSWNGICYNVEINGVKEKVSCLSV